MSKFSGRFLRDSRHLSRMGRYRLGVSVAVTFALLAALGLRLTGIGFGHGVLNPQADEGLMRSAVLHGLAGDPNPHNAVWGHLFHYLYLLVAAGWVALCVCTGQAATWTDAVAACHAQPWDLTVCGRAVSAVAGSFTVLAVYSLGRSCLRSRAGGVASAVLLSTLFLHVRDSHFATSDILLAANCTAALAAMAKPGRLRAGWAGFWTGIALATKLLAVTVVFTFLTLLVVECSAQGAFARWRQQTRSAFVFLIVALAVMLATQPFILLDPMETWYGLFGDLFNPERRPFEHGVNFINGSIIARYYIPQALGWTVGGLALLGSVRMMGWWRSRSCVAVVVYTAWSLTALVSVQRIFLRYLDPLLPALCVMAAAGIEVLSRWVLRAWQMSIPQARSSHRRTDDGGTDRSRGRFGTRRVPRACVVLMPAIAVVAASPNFIRDALLDHRLLQPDTRSLAGRWIEENVSPDSRVLWLAHGQLAAHMTMPWLHAPEAVDEAHARLREEHGLSTEVDLALIRWKQDRAVPTFHLVGVTLGPAGPERPGLEEYPMLEHHYNYRWLEAIDRLVRQLGLIRPESPRWDLMRRQVSAVWQTTPEELVESGEPYIVLTGLPCDQSLTALLRTHYDEVQVFNPAQDWAEYGGRMMYDMGDAWYLPNLGIERVRMPGPEIRIFRKRRH